MKNKQKWHILIFTEWNYKNCASNNFHCKIWKICQSRTFSFVWFLWILNIKQREPPKHYSSKRMTLTNIFSLVFFVFFVENSTTHCLDLIIILHTKYILSGFKWFINWCSIHWIIKKWTTKMGINVGEFTINKSARQICCVPEHKLSSLESNFYIWFFENL